MEIRYVGKSSSGMLRPLDHRKVSALRDQTHKANWIRSMLVDGVEYDIVVLEVLSSAIGLDGAEARWIDVGRAALGDRFTNATGGVGNDSERSPETRARMAAAWTSERRAAQAERARRNLVAAQIGRPLSEAHRAKLSDVARSRSPERLAHFARVNEGRGFSAEHKAKLSANHRSRKHA